MFKEGLKALKLVKSLKDLSSEKESHKKKVAANFINNLLDNEKGLFLKIGQVLGSKPGALDEFKSLTKSRGTAWKLEEIAPFIEKNLDKKLEDVFSEVKESKDPASIGQVHEATLLTGEKVAIKIQYPDIRERISNQLKLLNILPLANKVGPMKKWGINFSEYHQMIDDTLDEELSYLHEIKNQKKFQKLNSDILEIKTSKIFDDLSSDKIIIQSFEEGIFIDQVKNSWDSDQRHRCGEILLRTFFKNLFIDGFIQGDCNIGNYLFRLKDDKDPEIVFIDFGNCVEIPLEIRLTLLKLIKTTIFENDINPLDYFAAIGFDPEKLKHIYKALPLIMKVIFEPFSSNFKYDLKTWDLSKKIETILGDYKWWFRSAGDTDFFKVIKSFFGTVNLLEILETKLFWRKIFLDVTRELSDKLNDINPPSVTNEVHNFKSIAKNLDIIILENEKEKVHLSMPSTTLLNLEDFIDDDIKEKLKERNLDIKVISQEALLKGSPPQILFELVEGPKKYIVSLV